jgi:pimeloyl-ACP methyl ester carboxylesterase
MSSFLFRLLLPLFVVLAGIATASAETIGIVLMHGNDAMPNHMHALTDPLREAGYLIDEPEMCWSHERHYDKAYLDCFAEIEASIARLKAKGAGKIVVGGHSIGGNAAIAYAARRGGVIGVIGLAPAHLPDYLVRRPEIAASVKRAHAMVAAGKGDTKADFAELYITKPVSVATTASIYLSYMAPDGPAYMPANAAKVAVPVIWIAGNSDPTQLGPSYAFDKLPKNPLNRYVKVVDDHLLTPKAGKEAVIAWLKELAPQ